MKLRSGLHARDYAVSLAASGRYMFSSAEAQDALGVSADAARAALHRLARKGIIASPVRGIHVIVPPEYRALGCLPAEQFIPELMQRLGAAYYAGLLSAAQFHGAAHHRPQEFQVMVASARRPIVCGKVRVGFYVRKNLPVVATQPFNTPRGTIAVSSPEATAFDLIGYQAQVGGLDQVATVLNDLAERLDAGKLEAAAIHAPVPWAQRLGYLLAKVSAAETAEGLRRFLASQAYRTTPLLPSAPADGAPRDDVWKITVNADVEAEL